MGRTSVIFRSGRFAVRLGILLRIALIVGEGGDELLLGLGAGLADALATAVALVPRVRTALSCSLLGLTTWLFDVDERAAYVA